MDSGRQWYCGWASSRTARPRAATLVPLARRLRVCVGRRRYAPRGRRRRAARTRARCPSPLLLAKLLGIEEVFEARAEAARRRRRPRGRPRARAARSPLPHRPSARRRRRRHPGAARRPTPTAHRRGRARWRRWRRRRAPPRGRSRRRATPSRSRCAPARRTRHSRSRRGADAPPAEDAAQERRGQHVVPVDGDARPAVGGPAARARRRDHHLVVVRERVARRRERDVVDRHLDRHLVAGLGGGRGARDGAARAHAGERARHGGGRVRSGTRDARPSGALAMATRVGPEVDVRTTGGGAEGDAAVNAQSRSERTRMSASNFARACSPGISQPASRSSPAGPASRQAGARSCTMKVASRGVPITEPTIGHTPVPARGNHADAPPPLAPPRALGVRQW